jgi:hypothetical protein
LAGSKRRRLRDDDLPGRGCRGYGSADDCARGKKAGKLYRSRLTVGTLRVVLNTLLEAESLQESLIDFSDEFKR